MSRSYKKHEIVKVGYPKAKKFANRKVRRSKKVFADGCSYKKAYPQYDIADWIIRYPKAELHQEVESSVKQNANGIRFVHFDEDETREFKNNRKRFEYEKWGKFYKRK